MIVVAGHLCLDIIPALGTGASLEPGRLVEVGPATISTGGAVSNVGVSLHKLGAQVRLVGKIGNDPFGSLVRGVLGNYNLEENIVVGSEETSYTVVVSQVGQDRMFLHCPGSNDTFVADDVTEEHLDGVEHFHFGYPSLMAKMSADGGKELVKLFERIHTKGIRTSLDMSYPDPNSSQGRVDWESLLASVLPFVDIFLPSDDELAFMLPTCKRTPEALARRCRELGASTIVIKRGELGLYGLDAQDNECKQSCYPVQVVGTTGSGDATIAGILYGLTHGFSFDESLRAGCAVGACSVEGPDAVTGVLSWPETVARFKISSGT